MKQVLNYHTLLRADVEDGAMSNKNTHHRHKHAHITRKHKSVLRWWLKSVAYLFHYLLDWRIIAKINNNVSNLFETKPKTIVNTKCHTTKSKGYDEAWLMFSSSQHRSVTALTNHQIVLNGCATRHHHLYELCEWSKCVRYLRVWGGWPINNNSIGGRAIAAYACPFTQAQRMHIMHTY